MTPFWVMKRKLAAETGTDNLIEDKKGDNREGQVTNSVSHGAARRVWSRPGWSRAAGHRRVTRGVA